MIKDAGNKVEFSFTREDKGVVVYGFFLKSFDDLKNRTIVYEVRVNDIGSHDSSSLLFSHGVLWDGVCSDCIMPYEDVVKGVYTRTLLA